MKRKRTSTPSSYQHKTDQKPWDYNLITGWKNTHISPEKKTLYYTPTRNILDYKNGL